MSASADWREHEAGKNCTRGRTEKGSKDEQTDDGLATPSIRRRTGFTLSPQAWEMRPLSLTGAHTHHTRIAKECSDRRMQCLGICDGDVCVDRVWRKGEVPQYQGPLPHTPTSDAKYKINHLSNFLLPNREPFSKVQSLQQEEEKEDFLSSPSGLADRAAKKALISEENDHRPSSPFRSI